MAHAPVTGERILWICEDIAEEETAHESDKGVTLLPRKLKNRYTYPTPSKSAPKTLVFSGLSRGKSVTPAACFFEYSWH